MLESVTVNIISWEKIAYMYIHDKDKTIGRLKDKKNTYSILDSSLILFSCRVSLWAAFHGQCTDKGT